MITDSLTAITLRCVKTSKELRYKGKISSFWTYDGTIFYTKKNEDNTEIDSIYKVNNLTNFNIRLAEYIDSHTINSMSIKSVEHLIGLKLILNCFQYTGMMKILTVTINNLACLATFSDTYRLHQPVP